VVSGVSRHLHHFYFWEYSPSENRRLRRFFHIYISSIISTVARIVTKLKCFHFWKYKNRHWCYFGLFSSLSLKDVDLVHYFDNYGLVKSVGESQYLKHLLILDLSTPARSWKRNSWRNGSLIIRFLCKQIPICPAAQTKPREMDEPGVTAFNRDPRRATRRKHDTNTILDHHY
jgi:hypothetical protein